MADALRSFDCVTADGPEKVLILDIIVDNDIIHLVCKGKREEPYVFEVNAKNGMRAARPDRYQTVLAMHQREVLRWQHATTS